MIFSRRIACLSNCLYSSIRPSRRSLSLESRDRCMQGVGVIGVPLSKGQSREGTELAPLVLREGGLVNELQRIGWDVQDYGDLRFDHLTQEDFAIKDHAGIKGPAAVANAVEQLATAVAQSLRDHRIPLVLGGDHSLGIGSIYGHSLVEKDLSVIWVDAHADINSALTTKTGHMHGMPVSFLIKEVAAKYHNPNQSLAKFLNIVPCISASNFAYIGLRDLDEAERHTLEDLHVAYYSIRDIDQLGIFEVISRALDRINPKLQRPIHVSFDIDAVDEYFAPSTGTSVPGGLTIREAFCVGEQVARTKMLTGLDMVEVNPLIGSKGDVQKTVNCAINIILSFLGRNRMGLYARHPSEQFYASH